MPKKGPATIEDRLHRIEGQIRGIEKMMESGKDIDQVVSQIQAVTSSLESVKLALIKKQIRTKLNQQLDSVVDLLK
ncbi:metal-sensing transcriptional repressor [Candidatus Dojkabacteria bacterium]|nr:metal-sensing transcriptional repressor [Candidatus Dojkabacteria bacterium]